MNKKLKPKKMLWVISFIHLLMAVIYQMLSQVEQYPFEYIKAAYFEGYSFAFEKLLYEIATMILGFLLIYVFWIIVIKTILEKRLSNIVILMVAVILNLLIYPNNWMMESDNLGLYSLAIRGIPEYWQNIYTGIFYRGCMLLLPVPIIITTVQTLLFVFGVYFFSNVLKNSGQKVFFVLPYVVFLIPETYYIMLNPYRGCLFTCMAFVWLLIVLANIFLKEKRDAKYYSIMSVIAAFLVLFRNENIILFIVWIFALRFIYCEKVKKTLIYMGIFACAFVIFSVPQKLGEKKYYGNDYSMINLLNVTGEILREEKSTMLYDGAEQDLNSITDLMPLEYAAYGLNGYRTFNYYTKGTVNQSLLDYEKQKQVIKAMGNMILHNLSVYFEYQVRVGLEANGMMTLPTQYVPEGYNEMIEDLQVSSLFGYYELLRDGKLVTQQSSIADFFVSLHDKWVSFLENHLWALWSRTLLMVTIVLMAVLIDVKNKKLLFTPFVMAIILQLILVTLVEPESRNVYFYPVLYMGLGLFITMCPYIVQKQS